MSQRTAALLLLFVSMVGVAAAKQKLRPTPESTPVRETAPDWSRLCLWYRQPAKQWTEALPVGNGRLGAMVFGGAADERLQLNEETLWSGGPYDPTRAGASAALPEVRRLVFEGRFLEAHDLFGRTLMGMPVEQMKYQPLGNLVLTFPGHDQRPDYRRQLDSTRPSRGSPTGPATRASPATSSSARWTRSSSSASPPTGRARLALACACSACATTPTRTTAPTTSGWMPRRPTASC